MSEINKVFSPEFRNRLDNIVWFNHLDNEVIQQVVDKFIVELQAKLDDKGVSLELTRDAKKWLAEHGYDKAMGARPMSRLIQEKLKKELANELLFGELTNGGVAKVGVKKDKLVISFENKKELISEK
jgi:ATP-dependent Clp protease ATP-binding subunit ClpA